MNTTHSENTITQVHGHAVMHLLASSPKPLSLEEIQAIIKKQIGSEVRFHTCAAEGLTLAGLMEFLLARNKIVESPEGFRFNSGAEVCDHE